MLNKDEEKMHSNRAGTGKIREGDQDGEGMDSVFMEHFDILSI